MHTSPYPRPTPEASKGRAWFLDLIVAISLLIAAAIPAVLVNSIGLFIYLAVPSAFLIRLGIRSCIVFLLLSFPYWFLLTAYCDVVNDPSSPYIHVYHEYFYVVIAYAFVRLLVMLGRSRQTSTPGA